MTDDSRSYDRQAGRYALLQLELGYVHTGFAESHFRLSFGVEKNESGKFWSWINFIVGASYIL
jgi:hypothetical protein